MNAPIRIVYHIQNEISRLKDIVSEVESSCELFTFQFIYFIIPRSNHRKRKTFPHDLRLVHTIFVLVSGTIRIRFVVEK